MLNQELLDRFWKDFAITTQEESLDFPFANIADVAKSLIKARNWIATLTRELVTRTLNKTELQRTLRKYSTTLSNIEKDILARKKTSFKTKEHMKIVVWAEASSEEKKEMSGINKLIDVEQIKLDDVLIEIEVLENLLKRIEKSTDWLVQYLNWNKFELRGLQS